MQIADSKILTWVRMVITREPCVTVSQNTTRSIELSETERKGVRYTSFVAYGDSKNYRTIVDNNPYGQGVEIVKYECLGHVGKRMGARLRKLRREENLGGRGGLSDCFIKKVQSY